MKLGFDFGTCFSHIQCMVGNTPKALIATNIYMGKPSEYLHGVGNGYDFTLIERNRNLDLLIKDLKPKLRNYGVDYRDKHVKGAPTIGEIVKGFLYYYVDVQKKEFKKLKESSGAYEFIKEDIEEITITIPLAQGNFLMDDDYSNHLRNSLSEGLGLPKNKVHVLPEPFAAAISYLKGQKEDANILVFDLGGGTLDVTIVQYQNKKYTQIANEGKNIGGNDWDKELENLVKKKLNLSMDSFSSEEKAVFESKIVALKHALTTEEEAGFFYKGLCSINRKEFDSSTSKLRNEAMSVVDKALEVAKKKGISQSDINKVFLAGGGCEMPQIEQAMKEKFGWKVCKEEPLLSIAKGAALWSSMVADGLVEDMVQQSTSHAYGFWTWVDGEKSIKVMIEKNQEFQDGIIRYKSTTWNCPIEANQKRVTFTLYELEDSELEQGQIIPIEKGKSLNKSTTINVPYEYYSKNRSCDYKVFVEYKLTKEMELTMIIYDEEGNILEEKSFLTED